MKAGPIAGSAPFALHAASEDSEAEIRSCRQNRSPFSLMIALRPGALRYLIEETTMKRTTLSFLFSGAFLFSAAAFGISSHVDSKPSLMSRGDYAVGKQEIESQSRQALSRCRSMEGSGRELCKTRARAEERVKKADLAARYFGTVASAEEAKLARVRAGYDVAKLQCGSLDSDARAQCLAEARSDKARALAEARPSTT